MDRHYESWKCEVEDSEKSKADTEEEVIGNAKYTGDTNNEEPVIETVKLVFANKVT